MRRLVAAMIAVMMLVTIAGCGGGDEESGEVTTQTQTEAPPASTAAVEEEPGEPDLTPLEEQVFEPFPTEDEVLTDEIAERIEAEQPFLVYFYDDSQEVSDDQRAEIDAVLEDYRGLIELVTYDVGKYITISAEGDIDMVYGMEEDVTAKKVAYMFSDNYLGISSTPYMVFVSSDGYITYRHRGPMDRVLVEREVLRATE